MAEVRDRSTGKREYLKQWGFTPQKQANSRPRALAFMERTKVADKPFFVWWSSTRMHIFNVAKLKDLDLEENTIVMYLTDIGAETFTWPDGGMSMF